MDPTTCLEEMLDLAALVLAHESDRESGDADAIELAEHITALDSWIRKGGFLPSPWGKNFVLKKMLSTEAERDMTQRCNLVFAEREGRSVFCALTKGHMGQCRAETIP